LSPMKCVPGGQHVPRPIEALTMPRALEAIASRFFFNSLVGSANFLFLAYFTPEE
jgi:hypothetical protein